MGLEYTVEFGPQMEPLFLMKQLMRPAEDQPREEEEEEVDE